MYICEFVTNKKRYDTRHDTHSFLLIFILLHHPRSRVRMSCRLSSSSFLTHSLPCLCLNFCCLPKIKYMGHKIACMGKFYFHTFYYICLYHQTYVTMDGIDKQKIRQNIGGVGVGILKVTQKKLLQNFHGHIYVVMTFGLCSDCVALHVVLLL